MPETAQSVNAFSTVAKLDMPGTGKLIVLAIIQHKTLDVAKLMELTGESRRIVQLYRLRWIETQDETDETDETGCAKDAKPVSCDEDGQKPAPYREHARLNEQTTSVSSSQQQQPSDLVESGLLSLIKAEWNLYTDTEARTALLGEFRVYGEKFILDAYSNYLAEKQAKRGIVKPWKFIQKTARGMRDAPPPNVVAFAPKSSVLSNLSPLPASIRPVLEEAVDG